MSPRDSDWSEQPTKPEATLPDEWIIDDYVRRVKWSRPDTERDAGGDE